MFRRIVRPIVTLALFAAATLNASAQSAPVADPANNSERGRMAACRADAKAYCATVEAGRGRRIACLMENRAKLSPACAAVVDARAGGVGAPGASPSERQAKDDTAAPATRAKGQGRGRLAACRTDVATFCQSAAKGGSGRMACLKQNEASLSADCKAALAEARGVARGIAAACKIDRDTLCKGIERGGGRIARCLKDNTDKLSPACSNAMANSRGGPGQPPTK